MSGGLCPWIPPPEDLYGDLRSNDDTRRKIVSTKQCIKAKTHSQGGRVNRIWLMEPDPRIFWDWILLDLSGLGEALTYSGVVSNEGCLQSLGKLPQVGKGSFDPTRFVT